MKCQYVKRVMSCITSHVLLQEDMRVKENKQISILNRGVGGKGLRNWKWSVYSFGKRSRNSSVCLEMSINCALTLPALTGGISAGKTSILGRPQKTSRDCLTFPSLGIPNRLDWPRHPSAVPSASLPASDRALSSAAASQLLPLLLSYKRQWAPNGITI